MPANLLMLDVQPPNLKDETFCPGGVPGRAGFCPHAGVWVASSHDRAQILSCETSTACTGLERPDGRTGPAIRQARSGDCRAWLDSGGMDTGAICGEGRGGFLCGTCMPGYTKVDSACLICPTADPSMLVLTALLYFTIAIFLLTKSMRTMMPTAAARQIWYKLDKEKTGELGIADVKIILEFVGTFYTEEQLQAAWVSDFHARSISHKIRREDFMKVHDRDAPSAAMGTAIFFIQTFGLFTKSASSTFKVGFIGEIFNADAETSVESCMLPMSFFVRLLWKTVFLPALLIGCIFVAVPVWRCLRNAACLKCIWDKVRARPPIWHIMSCDRPSNLCPALLVLDHAKDVRSPNSIESVHIRRAALNVFLFLFAPLTRSCIEVLVCRDDPVSDHMQPLFFTYRCLHCLCLSRPVRVPKRGWLLAVHRRGAAALRPRGGEVWGSPSVRRICPVLRVDPPPRRRRCDRAAGSDGGDHTGSACHKGAARAAGARQGAAILRGEWQRGHVLVQGVR